jgi:tetratricopeptide (TPR) repeat protein
MSYNDLHAGKTEEAVKHLWKAMHKDPVDTETLLWLSYLLSIHAGMPEEALPVAKSWMSIDPLHPLSKLTLGNISWMKGDSNKAVTEIKFLEKQEPDNIMILFYLGNILAWNGQYNEALMKAEQIYRLDPGNAMGQSLRFLLYALLGDVTKANNAVSPSAKEWIWEDFHLPWIIAEGYSVLGENDEAIRWLQRTIENGIINYPILSTLDPFLENIRMEPEFQSLMSRIKPRWENLRRLK